MLKKIKSYKCFCRNILTKATLYILMVSACAQSFADSALPLRSVYAGVGFNDDMVTAQVAKPTSYGVVKGAVGRFYSSDKNGFLLGISMPYGDTSDEYKQALDDASATKLRKDGTSVNTIDGFFVHFLAGTLGATNSKDGNSPQYGAGFGLSYLWINHDFLADVGVTLGLARSSKKQAGLTSSLEPMVTLGASFNFGVF